MLRLIQRMAVLGAWVALAGWSLPPAGWQPRGYPLPELFVTGMADGGDGTIWLATLDGLYRFDGFAAHRVPGYPFLRAAHLLRGPDGAIWIGGNDGLVVYRGSFEVVLRDEGKSGVSRLSSDGKAIYFRYDQKLWRIDSSGNRKVVLEGEIGSGASPMQRGGIATVCKDARRICVSQSGQGPDLRPVEELLAPGQELFLRVAEDLHGTWWTTTREWLYRQSKEQKGLQKVRAKLSLEDAIRLERLPNGEVGVLGESFELLSSGVSLPVPGTLNSPRVTAATSDHLGDLWVAYRPYGLVRWHRDRNTEWREEASSRLSRRQDPYLQLFETGWIAPDGKRVDFDGRLNGLVRLDSERLLALTITDGVWVVDRSGRKLVHCDWPGGPLVGLTIGFRDSSGRIWLGGEIGLFEVVDLEGQPRILKRPTVDGVAVESVQDMTPDEAGRLWVAHTGGLCYFESGRWVTVRLPESGKGIGSLASAGKSMWVSSFSPGFFARLDPDRKGWKETRFDVSGGYGNVKSVWVHVDSRGWIWRAREDGVMVARGDRTGPLDWLELNSAKGLELGRLRREGFTELPDGRVWLMGLRQSLKLKPEPAWFAKPAPGVKPGLHELLKTAQSVTLQLGGLGANPLLEYPIQYRLRPLFEEWRGSRDGRLEFRDLRDGEYHLEARFGGDENAAILDRDFTIGTPIGIEWGWIAGGVAIATLFVWGLSRTLVVRRWLHQWEKARYLKSRGLVNEAHPWEFPSKGEVLQGRYEIVGEAAVGGFSRVFQAARLDDGMPVAIKIVALRKEQESWLRARYAHELAALGGVEHEGVVRLLDSWVGEMGQLVLVMPYLKGPSLRGYLERGSTDPGESVSILKGIAEALEAIHRVGIVHLDLKPENVILTADPECRLRPVLIDLGTSGFRGAEDDMTTTKMLTGSAAYLAPERLTGHYSTASDIFALGVVALELFTGRQTGDFAQGWFEPGFGTELAACLREQWGQRATDLAEAIIEALQPSPRMRPASAVDWVENIVRILKRTQ